MRRTILKYPLWRLVTIGFLAILTACSSQPRYTGGQSPKKPRTSKTRQRPARPRSNVRPGSVITGISSFYGPDFHGKLTANGEVYDMYGVSAAHKTLPFNTIVRVTNLANRKNLIVRINDRGPYVAGRILDLSYGAALKLGFLGEGTTKVKIVVIEVGDGQYMKHIPSNP